MKGLTAKQFYENIKIEEDRYKLVNGLFIVKHRNLNKDVCEYVGEFLKKDSASNPSKTNKVILQEGIQKIYFNKKTNMTTTSLGFWKKMDIKFIEKPIKEILK